MAPTVFLERDAAGQILLGLRLIGEGDEERWASEVEPDAAPAAAAVWLKSRLAEGRVARIGTLCLDPRGAACNWLDVPGDEPALVQAAARQSARGPWGDWPEAPSREAAEALHAGGATLDWRATSLQPLRSADSASGTRPPRSALAKRAEPGALPTRRTAVLALSDLPVRLLLDELDTLGVVVDRVSTLAHAMAAAWDPGAATQDQLQDDPLVTRDTSDSAVVLVEPSGRLQWCWSSRGELLACGTNRLDPAALEGADDASRSAAGRIGADWLAWSAQLGRSPTRAVCLVPESLGSTEGAAVIGRAIGQAWPGASIDLFRVPDPIEATLARLHERSAGGRPQRTMPASVAIQTLGTRPGRAHRSMYRWTAGALVLAAAALIVLGVRLRGTAQAARAEAESLVEGQRGRVAEVLPPTTDLTYPSLAAMAERDRLRQALPDASAVPPARPVLAGAEQIGFAIASNQNAKLTRVTILDTVVSVQVNGADTRSVEFVPSTLEAGTDLFDWSPGDIIRRNNTYQTTVTGLWRSKDGPAGSTQGPAS